MTRGEQIYNRAENCLFFILALLIDHVRCLLWIFGCYRDEGPNPARPHGHYEPRVVTCTIDCPRQSCCRHALVGKILQTPDQLSTFCQRFVRRICTTQQKEEVKTAGLMQQTGRALGLDPQGLTIAAAGENTTPTTGVTEYMGTARDDEQQVPSFCKP